MQYKVVFHIINDSFWSGSQDLGLYEQTTEAESIEQALVNSTLDLTDTLNSEGYLLENQSDSVQIKFVSIQTLTV